MPIFFVLPLIFAAVFFDPRFWEEVTRIRPD